jgi:hypothetical protein
MNTSSRISSTKELLALQTAGIGFIINEDIPTRLTTIHRVDCATLTVDAFETKVIENGGANGAWYFAIQPGGNQPRRCEVCQPEKP